MKNVIFLIFISTFLLSCWPKKGVVKFTATEDNSYLKKDFKSGLNNNQPLSVLLRVPGTPNRTSEQGSISFDRFYNAIERELIENGFIVRDRQIFNELVANRSQSVADLAAGTETDLIIEITDIDLSVKYKTDNFIKKKTNKKVFLKHGNISMNGIRTKFKIYSIQKNELVGALEFNYAPCADGCFGKIDKYGGFFTYKNGNYIRVKNYQIVESSSAEELAKGMSKELINKLKS